MIPQITRRKPGCLSGGGMETSNHLSRLTPSSPHRPCPAQHKCPAGAHGQVYCAAPKLMARVLVPLS